MGQWSIYKGKDEREKILKIDMIESLYLAKLGFKFFDKNGKELKFEKMVRIVKRKIPEVEDLLDVYEDWREKGYILKTGFKFGAHFRIYFPGASPYKKGKEWIHSKHVLHVFPKNVKMRMSEWARAVRVAHSVRKTFIMGIPKMKKEDYLHEKAPINFFAYHRKGNEIEKPNNASPSFLVMALSEDEELSGKVLASALDRADELGLRLLLAISDRESSVTYYLAKRIELPNSRNKYYEIEWFNP
ncbi:MAG: tRNA-intron lyase [Candidatus Aenigmarchaeota archaeon ex4484_224]|nr:MAG: tRNA-intron lyase [Candidatus Aenigmarchaeota archaeon ex4484_224]